MRHRISLALVVLSAAVLPAAPALGATARPVKLGDRGPAVRAVQQLLVRDGFRTGVDGIFGRGTFTTVKRFQRAAHLPVVGYVGPATQAALRSWRRAPSVNAAGASLTPQPGAPATLTPGGFAVPPADAPAAVVAAIAAGNRIAHTPYVWGGGHRTWNDVGYDCSGSVSYVLHAAGLLSSPLVSGSLANWGASGQGAWMTIYANATHTFMVIAGLRFDTSGQRTTGSRWQPMNRSTAGFAVRHPTGL